MRFVDSNVICVQFINVVINLKMDVIMLVGIKINEPNLPRFIVWIICELMI